MKNKMKTKLIMLACISITFASCKKEGAELAQPLSPTLSMDEQVADLIKRADKNLYDEVYGRHSERDLIPGKDYVPGYFRIPEQDKNGGDVSQGYCLQVNMVCVAIVSTPGSSRSSLSGGNLDTDVDLQFSAADNARLIINSPQPVVKSITSFKTRRNSNGDINLSFN
ncbi:MAG: hypothetical protein H0W84_11380 [Bacteroidetes bacterium]|nr:hypothetical protein [Bacteroidota bacterium]